MGRKERKVNRESQVHQCGNSSGLALTEYGMLGSTKFGDRGCY